MRSMVGVALLFVTVGAGLATMPAEARHANRFGTGSEVGWADSVPPTELGLDTDHLAMAHAQGLTAIGLPEAAEGAGAVHVFGGERDNVAALHTLDPPASAPGGFGRNVAVSGSTLVVVSQDGAGAALHFYPRIQAGGFMDDPQTTTARGVAGLDYGRDIAFIESATGETRLAVGAPATGATGRGAVLVYRPGPYGWSEEARLEGGPRFGTSVAGHDSALAIGEPGLAGANGAVHLYFLRHVADNQTLKARWVSNQTVRPPSAMPGFGADVALDWQSLLVGAPSHEAGAAFIHARQDSGQYLRTLELTPEKGEASFGASVAITDGLMAVGAPGHGEDPGAVYPYMTYDGTAVSMGRHTVPAKAGTLAATIAKSSVMAVWVSFSPPDGADGTCPWAFELAPLASGSSEWPVPCDAADDGDGPAFPPEAAPATSAKPSGSAEHAQATGGHASTPKDASGAASLAAILVVLALASRRRS